MLIYSTISTLINLFFTISYNLEMLWMLIIWVKNKSNLINYIHKYFSCPVDEEIMGPFDYTQNLTRAVVAFHAHKFPYTSSVYYQCNVRLCLKEGGGCEDVVSVTNIHQICLLFGWMTFLLLIHIYSHPIAIKMAAILDVVKEEIQVMW